RRSRRRPSGVSSSTNAANDGRSTPCLKISVVSKPLSVRKGRCSSWGRVARSAVIGVSVRCPDDEEAHFLPHRGHVHDSPVVIGVVTTTTGGTAMLEKVFYTSVLVSDQDRALDFYTNVLGLEKRVENPTPDGPRFLTVGDKGDE